MCNIVKSQLVPHIMFLFVNAKVQLVNSKMTIHWNTIYVILSFRSSKPIYFQNQLVLSQARHFMIVCLSNVDSSK